MPVYVAYSTDPKKARYSQNANPLLQDTILQQQLQMEQSAADMHKQ